MRKREEDAKQLRKKALEDSNKLRKIASKRGYFE